MALESAPLDLFPADSQASADATGGKQTACSRLNPARKPRAYRDTAGDVAGPNRQDPNLTVRIAYLIEKLAVSPSTILANFYKQGREEMRERLAELLGAERSGRIHCSAPFHQLGPVCCTIRRSNRRSQTFTFSRCDRPSF